MPTVSAQAYDEAAQQDTGSCLLDDAPAQHLPGVLHDRRANFLAPPALLVRRRALAAAALLAVAAAGMVLPAPPVLARTLAAAVADVHVEGQPAEAGDHQQRQRDVEQQLAAGPCGRSPSTSQLMQGADYERIGRGGGRGKAEQLRL